MSGALDGIRVIDFSQYLAGPLLAMLFADHGADVIRVDPPGGPRWQDHANAVLQRGKRSIMLDLKQDEDQQTARQLIRSADIVIESFRPGVMDRLGVGPEAMTAANPRLIYCSIPGFASDDPRAGIAAYEGVVEAAAGVYLSSTWDPDGDPVFNALPLSSTFACLRAGQSVVAALIARQRTGSGQRIEVPLFDASFELIGPRGAVLPSGPLRRRVRADDDFILDAQFECADGRWVNLSWLEQRQLSRFAERFAPIEEWRRDGLLDEEKLRKPGPTADELKRRLVPIFKTRSAAEWARIANPDSDLAECLTTAEWLNQDEHARASRAVIELTDPEYGATRQLGYPFKLSKTPPEARGPRHALDADRASVLAELAQSANGAAAAVESGASTLRSALEGIRILDLNQVLAGPTSGRILAEFGADVVKINNPNANQVQYHYYVNTGKRTTLVDLKSRTGMDVFWRLVEQSDVIALNFSPQAAAHLGITEADIRAHKPDVVYSSISCYGWDGPRGTHRGHEQLGQAVPGVQLRWGQGFREPVMQSFPICDLGTGNVAAFGVLVALFHRLRTGEGQFVGSSLAQTGTFHQAPFMLDYAGRVWNEPGGQQAKGWGPLYRLYKGSDRWFFLAAAAPGVDARAGLAAVEGLSGVNGLNGSDLEAALSARFTGAPAETWVQRLTAAGIGAHVLRQIEENMEDAWVKGHGLSIRREFPELGMVRTVGPSGRMSLTPVRPNFPAPPPGTHTREVITAIGLGDRFEELTAGGAVAERLGKVPAHA